MTRVTMPKMGNEGWGLAVLFLLVQIVVVSLSANQLAGRLLNVDALMWCFAWLAIGTIPGFLFAIPKVVQRAEGEDRRYSQLVNTNLEQVSDWLTKILLGVGLVQLGEVGTTVKAAGAYMNEGIRVSPQFASAIMVLFSIEGFLFGYLTTRLVLASMFREVEREEEVEAEAEAVQQAPLPQPGEDPAPVSRETSDAARAIVRDPLSTLRPNQFFRWGRSQRILGNNAEALRALRLAAEFSPAEPLVRLEHGIALCGARQFGDALKELQAAAKSLGRDKNANLVTNVYGWLTFAALYVEPPEGFRAAIGAAEEFKARGGEEGDGSILLNLAAAYGQSARHLASTGSAKSEDVERARAQALEAVRTAAGFNGGFWVPRLRELLSEDYRRDPADDDLSVFDGDPEFLQVLGLTEAQAA